VNIFHRTQSGALNNAGINWEYRGNTAVEFCLMLPTREVVDYLVVEIIGQCEVH